LLSSFTHSLFVQLVHSLTSRFAGDNAYLVVETLEGQTLHITAAQDGFFVNRSTNAKFDPRPADKSHHSYILADTLSKV